MSATPTRATVDVRGTEVPYLTAGEGPPLLWLHGAGGSDSWSEAQDMLAGSFTVVAPAHPGFAGTPLPDWVRDVHDVTFHYVDLLAALDLREPTVVGISLGGWIATDLAVHRPDLLGALVLVDAVGLRPESPMPDLFIMEPSEAMGVLFGSEPPPMPPAASDADPADLIVRMYEEQAASARLMWKRPYDRSLDRRLHHVSVPALVVWGADDGLLPASHGRRLASLIPGARFEEIAGAGHVPPLQRPREFVELVTAFAHGRRGVPA